MDATTFASRASMDVEKPNDACSRTHANISVTRIFVDVQGSMRANDGKKVKAYNIEVTHDTKAIIYPIRRRV